MRCPALWFITLLCWPALAPAQPRDTITYSLHAQNAAEDSALERETSLLRRSTMAAIRVYQKMVSPLYGDVCNFYPSCSHYGFQAFRQHGFWQGLLLTSDRLQRCHLWAVGSGQYRTHAATGKLDDPVEDHAWSPPAPPSARPGL